MRIAVASGKGGTGKTTIATSLALSLASEGSTPPPIFVDCDVEAPNAHLFLEPRLEHRQPVGIMIPVVDESRCTYCGKCAEVCVYHAIAVLGQKTLVFPQLCHGCGSCTALCPELAISESLDPIGVMESGPARAEIDFRRGVLDIGKPMAVPIIRELQRQIRPLPEQTVILDAPPGTSCPVVATMRNADYLLLVTEPTPFGLHDLRLAAQVAAELDIPTGVIVNRENGTFPDLEQFCQSNGLPVLMRIPFERQIAAGIAQGKTLVDIHPEFISAFKTIFERIKEGQG
jgi:MinD superfamily P-loop ATPase